ncbi:hypothetical protein DWB61_17730 [Ancylomarina euxinus]|uniref:Uncharacterized protein n=1 Tax=Ancylomarina euxinus TaxID=2283627 RepID=A0A425XWA9_9BACT|nr:hypothetical protein [Ancylomarina euxinus]MCZ4696498.1 hypothetical protein [Ancylomarina euxinus]RRG18924.1 hypothetical protein DWB61_17730 [Ancylomarina euxinus]
MKKLIFILSIIAATLFGCQPTEEKGNKHIQTFFDTMAEFKCTDSTLNKVQLKFRYFGFNQEKVAYEYLIPDSIKCADFYNAYSNRITDAYYTSLNAKGGDFIDSLFFVQECDSDKVRKDVTDYYCNDPVFAGIFNTAFSSFYMNKKETEEYKNIIELNKTRIGIDSLLQISFAYIDIARYNPDRGFAFHCGCGTIPFSYKLENRVNFLISGFCKEALSDPKLQKAYRQIIKSLSDKIMAIEGEIENPDEICKKYEKELYRMFLEDGTLKKSLLEYYEKRKDIEPFEII